MLSNFPKDTALGARGAGMTEQEVRSPSPSPGPVSSGSASGPPCGRVKQGLQALPRRALRICTSDKFSDDAGAYSSMPSGRAQWKPAEKMRYCITDVNRAL